MTELYSENGDLIYSRPAYIGLAHELIHCLIEKSGIANVRKMVNGWYWGLDMNGNMTWLEAPVNELKVVGLPYLINITPVGADYQAVEIHQETTMVNGVVINENAIRAENNVELRKNYF